MSGYPTIDHVTNPSYE
jgi:ABC-type multidrug transport system fused ATPase/permease subunit